VLGAEDALDGGIVHLLGEDACAGDEEGGGLWLPLPTAGVAVLGVQDQVAGFVGSIEPAALASLAGKERSFPVRKRPAERSDGDASPSVVVR